jgi:catalase
VSEQQRQSAGADPTPHADEGGPRSSLIRRSGSDAAATPTRSPDVRHSRSRPSRPAVSDHQNSLKVGARGPTSLEDQHFREKIFHFDHERIPERVVHAWGYGAHGWFENYASLANITEADLFQRAGERTKVFVRFTTVAGNKGSPDLPRDV